MVVVVVVVVVVVDVVGASVEGRLLLWGRRRILTQIKVIPLVKGLSFIKCIYLPSSWSPDGDSLSCIGTGPLRSRSSTDRSFSYGSIHWRRIYGWFGYVSYSGTGSSPSNWFRSVGINLDSFGPTGKFESWTDGSCDDVRSQLFSVLRKLAKEFFKVFFVIVFAVKFYSFNSHSTIDEIFLPVKNIDGLIASFGLIVENLSEFAAISSRCFSIDAHVEELTIYKKFII